MLKSMPNTYKSVIESEKFVDNLPKVIMYNTKRDI